MQEELLDNELGIIIIVRNPRSKRLIARYRNGKIHLTAPIGYSIGMIEKLLVEMKPRLYNLKPVEHIIFDEHTQFKTLTFDINIKKTEILNFYVNLSDNLLNIVCPKDCNFADDNVQVKIRKYIENALRNEAKRILPMKVDLLAKQYNFSYSGIKINKSRTRWGSCSSRKSLNFSIFCFLLPEYLLDFVILHELCHTVEMNHGVRFWALLDKVTNNKAKVLTQELKNLKIKW